MAVSQPSARALIIIIHEFLATQLLNETSGPLCVTYYANVNATVADGLCCHMICGTARS